MDRKNKYDIFLILLIASLAAGGIGGSLRIPRILAVIFVPKLMESFRLTKDYTKSFLSFFLIFLAYCVTSLVWTPDIGQGVKEFCYYIVHFILFLEIIVFARYARDALRSISTGWMFAIAITVPLAIWELTTGNHFSVMSNYEEEVLRMGSVVVERPFAAATFGGFNGFIVFLCWAFPVVVYSMLIPRKKTVTIVGFALVLFVIAMVIIIASRGGVLALLIMGAIFVVMNQKNVGKLLLLLSILVVFYISIDFDVDLLFGITSRVTGETLTSDDVRSVLWQKAFHLFLNSLGFGVGIGGLSAAMNSLNAVITMPHNLFLEILAQYGLIFTLVFIIYLLKLFIKAKRLDDRAVKTIVYMSLIALPVYGIIDSGYLLNAELYAALASLTVFANSKIIVNH